MKISFIIITARSDYPYIGRPDLFIFEPTVESLKNQTTKGSEFEVIIVDYLYNQRKDYFKNKDLPFKVKHISSAPNIWHEKGLAGICTQFNKGIIYADGELLFFIGEGFIFTPEFCERLWKYYIEGYVPLVWYFYDHTFSPEVVSATSEEVSKYPVQCKLPYNISYNMFGYTGKFITMDHRPLHAFKDDVSFFNAPWEWWFGCSAAPLNAMLKINGFNQCVSPDTIIYGEEIKPINEVHVGDKILSHDGKLHCVDKVIERDYEGTILELTPSMFSIPIKITPNHPILSIRPKKYGRINIKPWVNSVADEYYKNREWVNSENIKIGDYVCFPVPSGDQDINTINISDYINFYVDDNGIGRCAKGNARNKQVKDQIQFNKDFLRFIGYYLSEGCYIHHEKNTTLKFSFHKNEIEYADDVCRIAENLFGIKARIKLEKNVRNVYVGSCTVARFIDRICHHGAKTKKIPYSYINLPDEKLIELLRGLINGDGSIMLKNERLRITYATTSTNIAYTVMLILAKLGVTSFISKRIPTGFGKNELYELVVSGRSARRLADLMNMPYNIEKRHKNIAFIYDGFVYYPIRKIEKNYYKGKVYNLEVEEAHSYVSSFILHNCFDGDKSLFDCDVGSRLELAGKNKFGLFKELFIIRLLNDNTWSSNFLKKIESIKCNYPLIHWSRHHNHYRANDHENIDEDIKWCKEVYCVQHCNLKEFCMKNHPWQYPFEHKEGYYFDGTKWINDIEKSIQYPLSVHKSTKEGFEYWRTHVEKIDLAEERQKRIAGDEKYKEGTFIMVKECAEPVTSSKEFLSIFDKFGEE